MLRRLKRLRPHDRAATAHEEAARTHERVAKLAEKYGGNIDAPWHRRAASKEREEARSARLAAMEAQTRMDP